jgi:hypothetical protein
LRPNGLGFSGGALRDRESDRAESNLENGRDILGAVRRPLQARVGPQAVYGFAASGGDKSLIQNYATTPSTFALEISLLASCGLQRGLTTTSLRYGIPKCVNCPILAFPSDTKRADRGFLYLLESPWKSVNTSAILSGRSSTPIG